MQWLYYKMGLFETHAVKKEKRKHRRLFYERTRSECLGNSVCKLCVLQKEWTDDCTVIKQDSISRKSTSPAPFKSTFSVQLSLVNS